MMATAVRWFPCTLLALLAVAAGGGLVRELTSVRPLPPPPILAEAAPSPLMVVARQPLGGPVETAQYAIIAMRNLFSASRGEETEATATATGPRLFLHGVVLDGLQSRAYIEDPATQRVSGYALGDAIGGGQLVRILEDRVVIRRPEGLMEVMLKDPAKPQPAPPGAPAPAGPPTPGAPGSGAAAPATEPAAPATPGLPVPPPAPAGPAAPAAEIAPSRTPPQGPK
jgi:Type II secretion system protein C